jgi:hypothetical protein
MKSKGVGVEKTYLETHHTRNERDELGHTKDHIPRRPLLLGRPIDGQLQSDLGGILDTSSRDERTAPYQLVPILSTSCSGTRTQEPGDGTQETTDPTGVNVSKPLAVLHGSPLALTASWIFRAVMSTARAGGISLAVMPDKGSLTVSGDIALGFRLRDIPSGFPDNDA